MKQVVYPFNEAQVGPAAVANTHPSIVCLQLPTSPLKLKRLASFLMRALYMGGVYQTLCSGVQFFMDGSCLHIRMFVVAAHLLRDLAPKDPNGYADSYAKLVFKDQKSSTKVRTLIDVLNTRVTPYHRHHKFM